MQIGPNIKPLLVRGLVVLACLVAAFSGGYFLGLRNVSDNGTGINTARNQLDTAGTAISNAASGISQAAGSADKIGSGISQAKESAVYIQRTADDSAAIIADCKSIIAAVRTRGKKDPIKN